MILCHQTFDMAQHQPHVRNDVSGVMAGLSATSPVNYIVLVDASWRKS
jgi:hypothetical protein